MTNYTVDNLPNNLRTLRTGSAQDGRMLVYTGSSPERQQSVLRDLRLNGAHSFGEWATSDLAKGFAERFDRQKV